MMYAHAHLLGIAVTGVLVSGCSGLTVYDGGSEKQLPGVPFYVKTPQCVQSTAVVEALLNAYVTVTTADGKTIAARYPSAGSYVIPDTPQNRQAIAAAVDQIKRQKGDPDSDDAKRFLSAFPNLASQQSGDRNSKVVKNSWATSMIVTGSPTYYINYRVPLFGSGSGAFELSSDNTLSKAQSNITDETAKTLLGVLPIKEALTARIVKKSQPDASPAFVAPSRPKTSVWTYEVHLEEVKIANSLQKVEAGACTAGSRRFLTLSDVTSGAAQLVSREDLGAPKEEKPTDKNSLLIRGTITLPAQTDK